MSQRTHKKEEKPIKMNSYNFFLNQWNVNSSHIWVPPHLIIYVIVLLPYRRKKIQKLES